jgi:hypothetical protein
MKFWMTFALGAAFFLGIIVGPAMQMYRLHF